MHAAATAVPPTAPPPLRHTVDAFHTRAPPLPQAAKDDLVIKASVGCIGRRPPPVHAATTAIEAYRRRRPHMRTTVATSRQGRCRG